MSAELSPWVVILGFVSALATTIIIGLRGLISGRIVVGRHYEDAQKREQAWQTVAETALAANRELSEHFDTLLSAVRASTETERATLAAQQETMAMVRSLGTAQQETLILLRSLGPSKRDAA